MRIQLNSSHPEKNRVEALLRALSEPLEQIPFTRSSLKESGRIDDAVRLVNPDGSLTIIIIFIKDYSDATPIATANFAIDKMRWGQNGSIMYVVESADDARVSEVVSMFAGKE